MKFVIKLKDRFDKVIKPPFFDSPMHFMIDKTNVETTFDPNLPPFTPLISYHHDVNNFQREFVKKLTEFDVAKGFLVWKMFVVSIFIFTNACLFLLGCWHVNLFSVLGVDLWRRSCEDDGYQNYFYQVSGWLRKCLGLRVDFWIYSIPTRHDWWAMDAFCRCSQASWRGSYQTWCANGWKEWYNLFICHCWLRLEVANCLLLMELASLF